MKNWTRREIIPLVGIGLAGGSLLAMKRSGDQTDPYRVLPKYTRPKALKAGDYVGICAPAGALRRKEEVDEFTAILEGMGFRVKVGMNVNKKWGYFAGTNEERAQDIMTFIEDSEVKAIFFLRGGWGCARIIPHLDFEKIKAHPKIIMGFSDVTTLLNAILVHSGIVTFHGPSGNSSWNEYTKSYIRKVLMDGDPVNYKNNSGDSEIKTYTSGKATGHIWGGNLSVICSLIGTPYLPTIRGILFLEDVSEEPYSIDRMLTQLKQSGILNNCHGIILGNFRKCFAEEPDRSFTLEEVFEQHFRDIEIPVYSGAQIGHTENKFTVPLGVLVAMNADTGTFELTENPVIE